jgi:hypothetical protein
LAKITNFDFFLQLIRFFCTISRIIIKYSFTYYSGSTIS